MPLDCSLCVSVLLKVAFSGRGGQETFIHAHVFKNKCCGAQDGLDARIRTKEEAKLQVLREAVETQRASERERTYAVRYHKVRVVFAQISPVYRRC